MAKNKEYTTISNNRIINFLKEDLTTLETMIQKRQEKDNNYDEYNNELELLNYMQRIIIKL